MFFNQFFMSTQQHPLSQFHFCPKCGSRHFEINNFKSKKCHDCGFVYYFNSSASVAVFITDPNGRLLVAERAHEPAKGTWDLPGGFVDLHETAEESVAREVMEETGLEITHPRYCFTIPNIYTYSGFDVHTLDMFFEVQLEQVDTRHPSDDVAKLFLLSKEEIDPAKFGLTSIRNAVERWLKM